MIPVTKRRNRPHGLNYIELKSGERRISGAAKDKSTGVPLFSFVKPGFSHRKLLLAQCDTRFKSRDGAILASRALFRLSRWWKV
jgi:hypothetical protein